jgi:cell division protein FtsI (penicillin-binding protein 3)
MSAATPPNFTMRHRVISGLMLTLFLCMAGRATWLCVVNKKFLRAQGDARAVRTEPVVAHRGMIKDRNGEALAVSTPVVSIWVNPLAAKDDNLDVPALAKALGMDPRELGERISKNASKQFLYLKRHLAPAEANPVLAQDFPDVYGLTEYQRFYPEGEVTAHVIGFTNLDDAGEEGIELGLDKTLRGVPGEEQVIRDLKGNKIKDVALLKPARPGKDVELSFDSRAQYMAYRELAAAVDQQGAKAGSIVAIDVTTGEVLAMVNLPSYNPNNRVNLQLDDMRNRAAIDMFEPGSVMKPFTISCALEAGKVTPDTKFDTSPGTYQVLNKTVKDTHNYGVLDLGGIITKSSNVGATKVGQLLEPSVLPHFFQRFGFGSVTESGFPGESRGRLQTADHWHPVELATMAYGYGETVTVLQLTHAYATLGAGGIERPVSMVKVHGPVDGKRILDEKVVQQLMPMMESVVTADGTALRAAVPGYRVAGKTGTAHKAAGGGYSDKYMSLFVGLAPASHPRVAMAVVIDSPSKGSYYGGMVAAPVFSRVMAEMLRLMDVEPDNSSEHLATQSALPKPVAAEPPEHAEHKEAHHKGAT